MSQKSSPTDKLKSAVGKGDKSNKHITKISAKPSAEASQTTASTDTPAKTQPNTPAKSTKPTKSSVKKGKKTKVHTEEKPLKQVFILIRPFVALGRYIRDSWRELRQVRWPNRAATWKMTLAVLIYCAIFMIFVLLLDTLFTFLFNLVIKK